MNNDPSVFGSDEDIDYDAAARAGVDRSGRPTGRPVAPNSQPRATRPTNPVALPSSGRPTPIAVSTRKTTPTTPTPPSRRVALPKSAPTPLPTQNTQPSMPTSRPGLSSSPRHNIPAQISSTPTPQPSQTLPQKPVTLSKPPMHAAPIQRAPEQNYAPAPTQKNEYAQYSQQDQQPHEDLSQHAYAPRTTRQEQPINNNYEEYDNQPVSHTSPSRQAKKDNKKGKFKRPPKKAKAKSTALAGGRGQVIFTKWAVLGGIGILCFIGVKSIILPPAFPSQAQVLSAVQTGLNVTDFPASRAQGFVLSFADVYFTFSSDTSSVRKEDLANYVPESLISDVQGSFVGSDQTIIDGPYISGIRYVDNENAVFTISARVSTGTWLYVDIPVYYNAKTNAFAISGIPAFAGKPPVSSVPAAAVTWKTDDLKTADFENWAPGFLKAWAASDANGLLPLLSPDADVRAKYGLNNSVTYVSMSDLRVSEPLDATDLTSSPLREARVVVTWQVGENIATPTDETVTASNVPAAITYQASYQLLVKYDEQTEKWSIQDIRGGVATESAVTGTDSLETAAAEEK